MDRYSIRQDDDPIDPVTEMQLRTWARTHYQPPQRRDQSWHPVILDEMKRKDQGV